jgi:prepilin-type N-terminal cleavage/methylation domain-containing protein
MQIRSRTSHRAAFTLMEILVVIAIIVVVSAIAYPIYKHFQLKSAKTAGLAAIKKLSDGLLGYTAGNAGVLPNEDAEGKDRWTSVKSAAGEKAWYNVVPKHLGMKNVADFTNEGRTAAFYTTENLFFLPGAQYPDSKIERPLFAVAFNSRLVRPTAANPTPGPVNLKDVTNPQRTVMFMEQGLPGETKAHHSIGNKDYDGAPKGSAKSFVARYSGKVGIISFFDGHTEEVKADTVLTPTGAIAWTPESANDGSAILWTADPKIDPNTRLP